MRGIACDMSSIVSKLQNYDEETAQAPARCARSDGPT